METDGLNDPFSPPSNEAPDLHVYAGRWIALTGGTIAGQGLTRDEALESAKHSRPKERPQVRLVPPGHEASLFDILDLIRPALPADQPVHAVGGAVRDHLLHRPLQDIDFVLPENAIQAARRAANYLGAEFYPLDDTRDTGRILLFRADRSRLILDFSVYRGESLEEDLRGRDFTINAIAVDAHNPELVLDPLGGAKDIRTRTVRTCSPESFEDDPVRVLRAIRMATGLEFLLTTETRNALRIAATGLVRVSLERQRDEIMKILSGPRPAAALRVMEILGLLDLVFPELKSMKTVRQSPPHVHDVWEHTLATVAYLDSLLGILGALEHDPEASGNLATGLAVMRLGRYRQQIHAHLAEAAVPERKWRGLLVLAAIYHDAGKPATRSLDETGRIRFFKHEIESAKLLGRRAGELKLSNNEISRLKTIARHHMRPHFLAAAKGTPTRRAIYRFFRDTGLAGVDICLLNLADVLATYEKTLPPELWKDYLDLNRELLENWWERPAEAIRPKALITGRDLIDQFSLSPGPAIGKYLELVREAQACGEINDRDEALALVNQALKGR